MHAAMVLILRLPLTGTLHECALAVSPSRNQPPLSKIQALIQPRISTAFYWCLRAESGAWST